MTLVELRVGMHCDKCIQEIKRAIRKLEGDTGVLGVETYKLDKERQKVTVTGDVSAKVVLKTLIRSGKLASYWREGN